MIAFHRQTMFTSKYSREKRGFSNNLVDKMNLLCTVYSISMFMRDTFARRANKHRIYPSADCRFCELNTCSFQTEYLSEAEKMMLCGLNT